MTTQNSNPFVLPGLGQGGDLGKNPLMASMEMMRQAWQGLAGSGGLAAQSAMAAPISIEDLDRRIADLQTVENWLRMNLAMLSSTIQGMEVQRATIATLKAFMGAPGAASAAGGPSPLEVALGLKPGPAAAPSKQPAGTDKAAPAHAAPPAGDATDTKAATPPDSKAATPPDSTPAHSATQGWWDMLQKQFDTLAAATTATMQGAEALQAAAAQSGMPVSPSGVRPPAAQKAAAKNAGPAGKAPRKRAAASKKPKS